MVIQFLSIFAVVPKIRNAFKVFLKNINTLVILETVEQRELSHYKNG